MLRELELKLVLDLPLHRVTKCIMEFGQIFRRLGSQVTILHRADRLAEREDAEVSGIIADIMRDEGIDLRLNATLASVGKSMRGVLVTLGDGSEVSGSHILFATGRVPNTDGLNLASVGLSVDKRGYIATDAQLKTEVDRFAAGLTRLFQKRGRENYRKVRQAIFVSATPADYEKQHSGQIVDQVVRPTGLVDPVVEVRPATHQVDDVLQEIHERVKVNERVLITTLTKRMAEQLTDYLADNGVKVRYLHSDVDNIERVEILRDLRLGTFDVLVGINLLREGLDLPEVSLVAILDADKEGFLRAERSLIQTIGRAARNLNGHAILYADRITDSMRKAIDEMAAENLLLRRQGCFAEQLSHADD